jgi:uncharacterized tellurite resistance protein B-like protein
MKFFIKAVLSAVNKRKRILFRADAVTDKVILGVLLRAAGAVGDADNEFLPSEKKEIEKILAKYTKISKRDFQVVLTAARQGAFSKMEVYNFIARKVRHLNKKTRLSIIEDLFRVGYADGKLDKREFEVIRKASNLFKIDADSFKALKISCSGRKSNAPRT